MAADLKRAGKDIRKKASVAVRKAAYDIKGSAQNRAPVDTGKLKGSITTSAMKPGTLSVEIGPTANYGLWVETGTSRMGPQPYMGPAADKHEPAFNEAMAQLGAEMLRG